MTNEKPDILGNENNKKVVVAKTLAKETSEKITNLMKYFHKDDKRSATSIVTDKHLPYDIHPEEVNKRAWELIDKLWTNIPKEEQKFLKKNFVIIDILSLFHDVIEDCSPSDDFDNIKDEIRKKLYEIGSIKKVAINNSLSKIELLAKKNEDNNIDEKTGLRNKDLEFYNRLKNKAPFFIKLIKLADQSHNLSTLSGKEIKKALSNYIKVRKSWPIIFTKEELEILYKNKLLENPDTIIDRTDFFEEVLKNIDTKEGKRALKDILTIGTIHLNAISQSGESELLNTLHIFNPDALERILDNYTIEKFKSDIELVYEHDKNIKNAETLNLPIEHIDCAKNTLLIFKKPIYRLKDIENQSDLNDLINNSLKKLFFRAKRNIFEFGEDANVPNEFLEIMLSYLNITETSDEFNKLSCLDIAKKLETISNEDFIKSIPLLEN